MSMTEEKLFYDLTLPNSLTGSAIRFTQASDPNPKLGLRPIMEVLTGSPYVTFTGAGEGNPDFTFMSKDLQTTVDMFVAAYGVNPAHGFCFAPFTGNGDVGYKAMLAGSTHTSPLTAAHDIHRFENPLVYLQGFSAQQNGDVSARLRMCPQWATVTDSPKTLLTGQMLNSVLPTTVSIFTMGPVKVNGSFVTGLKASDISFELGVQEHHAGGGQWPSMIYGQTLIARVNLSSKTASYLATSVEAITSLSVYFAQRKGNSATQCWGAGENKHIKFTASAGCKITDALTGGAATAPIALNIAGAFTLASNQQIT
jgi:hypothetical protein